MASCVHDASGLGRPGKGQLLGGCFACVREHRRNASQTGVHERTRNPGFAFPHPSQVSQEVLPCGARVVLLATPGALYITACPGPGLEGAFARCVAGFVDAWTGWEGGPFRRHSLHHSLPGDGPRGRLRAVGCGVH